jgi:GGDEF domain-containing protein
MGNSELVVWSMAAGGMLVVLAFSLAELAVQRTPGALQAFAYQVLAFTFVVLLCGLASAAGASAHPQALLMAQVLIGPLCNAAALSWLRSWLSARDRDSVLDLGLRTGIAVALLAAVALLLLPRSWRLPAAATVCLLNAAALLWLSVRAWLLGDRLAAGMATAGALSLPGIAGSYALALGAGPLGIALQALIATCAVGSGAAVAWTVWLRNHAQGRAGQPPTVEGHDPVTRLPAGASLVQLLIRAQRRRRRTRRDGAVIAVMVFGTEPVAAQAGAAGLNDLFVELAHRLQLQVSVVNPVGRYWDRCFVCLVETIPSPAWMRTLGLRVAASLRRPLAVRTRDGQQIEVRPDIGVGVLHLTRQPLPVEDLLHEAERIAAAARAFPSRAATLQPGSGEVVAVEAADLGPRRHRHPVLLQRGTARHA